MAISFWKGKSLTPSDWAKDAACKETTVDFYSQSTAEKKAAKAICEECPVKFACLQSALDNKERFGIWGGADEIELRKDQAINAKGEAHVSTQGKIRCPYCGPLSTKYLEVIDRHRTRTEVKCSNCGLHWTVRKLINKRGSNW